MVERRDVELLVRAKDLSRKPLRDVSIALDQISTSLARQVEAAKKGEASYQELADSFRQVQDAGRALAQQQALVDRFTKLNAESAKLAANVETTARALQEYRATVDQSATVTKKQESAIAALEKAFNRADAAYAKNGASLVTLDAQMSALGIDSKNLADTQRQIVSSATQAGQAATVLATAMSGYAKNTREARDAAKALAAEQSKAQAISRVNAALAEQAAARSAAQSNAQSRTDDVVASAQRLAAGVGAIRTASGGFAASLRDIADPASTARASLAGLESQVKETSAVVDQGKGPVRNYAETLLQLSAAQKAAERTGNLIDTYQSQTDALRQARAQFVAARVDVRSYQQQVVAAGAPNDALTAKLRAAETALAASARQYRTLAEAARATQTSLRAAGVDTQRVEESQRRLTAVVTQSAEAARRLNAQFAQFGSAGRGGVGLLGLTPYQVQNLGFQINDFFTQIAAGTSASQAFAQQFGQVVQVFGPGAFSTVARWVPLFAGIAAAAVTAAAAVNRLNETQASDRNFAARAAIGPQDLGVTPAQLTQIAREVSKVGAGFNEARTALIAFVNAGVISGGLQDATELAVRYARITGTEIPQATQLFVRGLTEGRDGFNALLAAQVNFSASARETITNLLDAGRAGEAQRVIINELRDAFRSADEQGLSPFQRASREIRNAWKDVLDELGKTGIITALSSAMSSLAERGRQLAGVMRTLRGEADPARDITPQQAAAERTQVAAERVRNAERTAESGSLFVYGSRDAAAEAARNLPELRRQLAQAQAEEEALGRATGGTAQATAAATAAAQQRTSALQAQLDVATRAAEARQREALINDKNANADARREAVRQRARDRVNDRTPGIAQTQQGRDLINQEIDADLRDFERKLAEELKSSNGAATARVRRDFQAIRTDITETLRVRDEAIRSVQEDVTAGSATPAEAIQRIQDAADRAQPALRRLADEARRFRDQQPRGDAVRQAALDGLVAQAERQAASPGTRQGVSQVLSAQQTEVQRLVQERQQFVQTQGSLEQQGVVTRTEAEQNIVEVYRSTNDELSRQISLLEEAASAARANGSITEAAYAGINAQAQLYRANLERINPETTKLKNSIEQGFTSSVTTAFNSAAEAVGNLIAGAENLKDVIDDVGKASLQFFADFLKSIAQAIIQQQALVAVKLVSKAIGAFHGGGVIGRDAPAFTRSVSPAWFANAPRYHSGSGGPIGLRPDEQAAILQKGEEVLAKNDPRNILNGGGSTSSGGGGGQSIRNVLAVGDDEIANAMSGPPGEQVFMNFLRRNAPTVRQIIR